VRVRWLKTANRNLDDATEYIAREDPKAAKKMYIYIRKYVADLAEHPEMGRPGRMIGTRELVIEKYPYLVPYRICGNEVQVLRVFHTSRRPQESW
jgi:addiction module RelE/StbE family toxin